MYSNEKKAQGVSYTNMPGLTSHDRFTAAPTVGVGARPKNEGMPPSQFGRELIGSYSSFDLPSRRDSAILEPHSRKTTPNGKGWLRDLDLSRLFGFGEGARRGAAGEPQGDESRSLVDEDDLISNASSTEARETMADIRNLASSFGGGAPHAEVPARGPAHRIGGSSRMRRIRSHRRPSALSRLRAWFDALRDSATPSSVTSAKSFVGPGYESDYLALVPLHDPRLNGQWPLWAFALCVALASLCVFLCVFFFVQRSVEVNQGELVTRTSAFHYNISGHSLTPWRGAYTLDLEVDMPVHNHNYFGATVSGDIGIYLFDYKGGDFTLQGEQVDPRTTRLFSLTANASHFDDSVTTTIIARCTMTQFKPHKLQFVLKGHVTSQVLRYRPTVTHINTYAIVPCNVTNDVIGAGRVTLLDAHKTTQERRGAGREERMEEGPKHAPTGYT